MFNLGPEEILLILILALLVFGPKRLPEVGRTIGRSLREFRRTSEQIRSEFSMSLEDEGDDFETQERPGYETPGSGELPAGHADDEPATGLSGEDGEPGPGGGGTGS